MYVTYDTLSEAIEDRAIARGWIPNWTPQAAINIHEVHNLDTSSRAISFTFPNANALIQTLNCQDVQKPLKPAKKTDLFPQMIHLNAGVKNCDDLFVFVENSEHVHIWAN